MLTFRPRAFTSRGFVASAMAANDALSPITAALHSMIAFSLNSTETARASPCCQQHSGIWHVQRDSRGTSGRQGGEHL